MPSANIYEMMKDNDGFIWFGTDDGVCRFDGQQIKVFTVDYGLADNTVIRCYQDKSGRIWFYHLNFLPSYYENGVIKSFEAQQDGVRVGVNSRMSEMSDSSIYIGCMGGVLKIYPDLTTSFFRHKKEKDFCTLGQKNDVLYYAANEDLKDIDVRSKNIDNVLVQFSKDWNFGYSAATRSFEFFLEIAMKDSLAIKTLNEKWSIKVQKFGDKFYFSTKEGVCIYTYKKARFFLEKTILPDEICSSVLMDELGGMWVSTLTNGLFHIPENTTNEFRIKGDLVSCFHNSNDDLYVFTRGGKFYKEKNKGDGRTKKCIQCIKNCYTKYRKANPELLKQQAKKYYGANKDAINV